MIREIPLTRGYVALVDEEDYDYLAQFKWYARPSSRTVYAMSKQPMANGTAIMLHRVLLNPPPGMCVDHRDRNGLNNSRSNLRIATRLQNSANCVKPRKAASGYRGVYPNWSKWAAMIGYNYRQIFIGNFKTPIEAAMAYNAKATELLGDFAILNELPEVAA